MPIGIEANGIVERQADGRVVILRPSRSGTSGVEIEAPEELTRAHRLDTGDVVEGDVQSGEIRSINGLTPDEAEERPQPRTKRSSYERIAPHLVIRLAAGPDDLTGRMLDVAAPFGIGCAGIIYGPHGSGQTRSLRAVVEGTAALRAVDVQVILLLIRSRGEEITDWRRRFPEADVVVCPSGAHGATPDETLRLATLVLESAQRQTELGRHVFLAIDSLTGLWGAMLEVEGADAQAEADVAKARAGIAEWMSRAGDFGGEGLLGSGIGGSLTIVGTAWHHEIDLEEEEDRESHPHLRLLEHVLHETNWRVKLSGELVAQRMFPAIDTSRCFSKYDMNLVGEEACEGLAEIRSRLADSSPIARWESLAAAIASTESNEQVLKHLPARQTPESSL